MTLPSRKTAPYARLVLDGARSAAKVALSHFQTGLAVEAKKDGSPVTRADRETEAAFHAWVGKRFPRDGIVGEEFGDRPARSNRRWFIDPIDGTKSFIRGVPLWGTLLALEADGYMIAGALVFPALGEWVCAGRGEGCFSARGVARVSNAAAWHRAAALTTDERLLSPRRLRPLWERVGGAGALRRTWGDAYGYYLVATGRAELMIDEGLQPWDSAPLRPIIEEAGGTYLDLDGDGRHVIASNRALAPRLRGFLPQGVRRSLPHFQKSPPTRPRT